MPCPDANTLTELVSALLAPSEQAAVEAHVDACEDCHALLVAMARALPAGPADEAPAGSSHSALGDRYQLRRVLGAGGMSLVYEAFDRRLRRRVALKVMLDAPGDIVARLRREAEALAMLRHPNVAQIFDVGIGDAHAHIVTELVDGGTLTQWLGARPRAWQEIIDVMLQIGRGLQAAHELGLVHRDVSPHNIVVADDGRARLLDFGLVARRREASTPSHGAKETTTGSGSASELAGTPGFVAPEVLGGAPAMAAADQFALCVVFDPALSGDPGTPRRVRKLVARGMQPDPGSRFPSVGELVDALADAVERSRRRRPWRWAAAAFATGAVAVGLAGGPEDPASPPSPCVQSEADMAATFGAEARTRLSEGMPMSRADATRVLTSVERYVADWRGEHAEACASEPSAWQERRVACLDDRHEALAALLRRLADGGRAALGLEVVLDAIDGLPPAAECRDPPPRDSFDPAADPEVWARRRRVARMIDEASAAGLVGDDADASRLADEALAAARQLDAVSLQARALFELGRIDRAAGRFDQARGRFADAAQLAAGQGDADLAAQAWIAHFAVLGHDLSDPEGAEAARRAFDASLARLGPLPPRLEALREYTLGVVGDQLGGPEAAAHLERARQLYVEAFGEDHRRSVMALEALAVHRARAGDRERARGDFERVIQSRRRRLGPSHPEVAAAWVNLAALDALDGRFAAATTHARAALAIADPGSAPAHPTVVTARAILGQALLYDDQPAAALEHLEATVAARATTMGERHPGTTSARLDLIRCLDELERPVDALAELREAVAAVDAPGVPPGLRGTVLVRSGRWALRDGELERAREACEAAVEATREGLEPVLGEARFCLGQSLAGLGRRAEALAMFEASATPAYVELSLPQTRRGQVEALRELVEGDDAARVDALVERLLPP